MSVKISQGLWVFFGLSRGNTQNFSWCFSLCFFNRNIIQETLSINMGGEVKKLEPEKCHYWKKKKEVWHELEKGKVTSFIKKIHGYKPHLMDSFYKAWDSDKNNLW